LYPSGRQICRGPPFTIGDTASLICYTNSVAPYYTDTDPKIEALQIELLRTAPPWRKMEMLASLNASARSIAIAGLRLRYPDANDAEMHRYLAELLLGVDLARKVLGEKD